MASNEGFDLFKSVTRQPWLVQPEGTLQPFIDHGVRDAWWKPRGQSLGGCWEYDRHAAFLAAACSVKVGVGNYVLLSEPAGCELAGLYCLDIPDVTGQALPFLVHSGESWFYAPLVSTLRQANVSFVIRKAYVWPESRRVFYSFYEHLKARREAGEDVKYLYVQAFGMLAHKPGRVWKGCVYRPDWYNLIKEQNKFLMYLNARQVFDAEGIWPVAMKTDALIYERQVTSLKLGDGIGSYRESKL